MPKLFLDIETSGIDSLKHSILSIGIVISLNGIENYKSYYAEIKYDELVIMPESIEVNNFDFRNQKDRITLEEADKAAFDFVREYFVIMPEATEIDNIEHKTQKKRMPLEKMDKESFDYVRKYFCENDKPMAIGLNVGEFDLKFINMHMPALASILSRRSVNINSLIYLLADIKSLDFTKLKQDLSEQAAIKVDGLELGLTKHNALYDAIYHLSLYTLIKDAFLFLKS